MAEFPALPLWTDAYLSDTHPDLSLEEHGAYLLLLQFAWRRPDCALPDDDAWMARRLGLNPRTFTARIKGPVLEKFWTRTEAGWINKRLRKEREFLSKKSRKSAEAARARWAKTGAVSKENKGISNAGAMRPHDLGIELAFAPTPTPTHTIPVGGSNDPPAMEEFSVNRVIFTDCLPVLVRRGVSEETARSLLAKWKRKEGPGRVIEAVEALDKNDGQEPISYIVAFFQNRPRRGSSGRDQVGL